MNLKSLLVALSLLWTGTGLFAQSMYYWADGNKISLEEDRSSVVMYVKDAAVLQRIASPRNGSLLVSTDHQRAVVKMGEQQSLSALEIAAQMGIPAQDLRSAGFGYKLDDGFPIWMTHEVVLQMAPGADLSAMKSLLETYGARYLRTDFETIVLDVADLDNVLPLANALQESGSVTWATPDIYAEVTLHADPLFGQQFQMHNTGQTIDGFAGTNDADCNALEAWGVTLGSSSITVAVIDDGLEAHEDLETSSGASRVLGGYTPVNGGNGTPNSSGRHGLACGGIIAASHNNLGVQGVAPNVNLRSVNIFQGGETTQDLANGVTWAKNNGGDVLSNSWGYNSCTFSNSTLTNAIADAVNNGRGGLGCVVAFSSGNSYGSCVNYPANLSTVIAVGAFGNDGIISDYSNEGTALDIVAPSNDINGSGFLSGAGVRTTDRMGGSGYSSGNYTTGFGGTSASCPVVAGVAALVLSVNPNLTEAEVKNILYTTAIDMGSSGRDNTYGWGRVNAFAAVNAANGGGGGGGCSATATLPYSEGFESGIGAWSQATGDDLDWTRRSGGTPSSNTGPSGAAAGSWYMYVEASSPNYPSKNTIFNSPCFDLSSISSPNFSFEYHMLGNAVGTLNLQASTDGSSWTTVWTRSGTQGSAWLSASVDLSSYAGESEFRLRFSGTTASSWQGDMCIDGLSFTDGGGGGGGCPTIDFSSASVTAYGNGQDQGSSQVQDGGATLFLQNNAWKDITYNYTVTANTVIEFDFRSTDQGEIHGIGFDDNESISSNRTFKVHGTQSWGITNYDNYSGSAFTTYTIPVGSFYTGTFNRMFFVCDDDAGSSSNAYFRNVKVYEGSCAGSNNLVANNNVSNIQAQMGTEGEYSMNVYPSPAQSELNVSLEGLSGSFAGSIHDLSGKQVWSGNVANSSRIEVSQLPSGMYLFQVQMENGSRMTRKFVKN